MTGSQTPTETKSSFMWDHWRDVHSDEGNPDKDEDFQFEMISKHRDPFERQITEAVNIEKALDLEILVAKDGNNHNIISLNRRFEHFCPRKRPPRF